MCNQLCDIRGLGGKLGDRVAKYVVENAKRLPHTTHVHSKDTKHTVDAIHLQEFTETQLVRAFGEVRTSALPCAPTLSCTHVGCEVAMQ